MHYKISSLVLNAGKHQNGSREVYIAQPDVVKEDLAGKLFFLAEIDGRKTETKEVIDFIITSLQDFYYNDEKIFLRDKIEGLTLDNIFEAALAKLNKALLEFLAAKKIVLHAEDTNLIVGLVFDNKLLFSNFGRNKALLVYQHQDQYELINVEANATDVENEEEVLGPVMPKFFASVVSGEIPAASYFFFCNEALPEYLANKDLINIVTKLPPMVAAEQIKGVLGKLNSYVPFLGIIIKNTFGLSPVELKEEDENDNIEPVNQSAHNSISHLNYTEKKTEQMLAPAGLINWQKLGKIWKKLKPVSGFQTNIKIKMPHGGDNSSLPSLSQQRTVFAGGLVKEKKFFAQKDFSLIKKLKTIGLTIVNLFNPSFWQQSWAHFKQWTASLHPRNRLLLFGLAAAVFILIGSLIITGIHSRQQKNQTYFDSQIAALEEKKNEIDLNLALPGNEDRVKTLIGESLAAIDALPVKGTAQSARRDQMRAEIEKQRAQIQKLTTVDNPEKIGDFKEYNASAEAHNLIVFQNKLYAADPAAKAIYVLDANAKKIDSLLLSGDFKGLDKPMVVNNHLYYLNNNALADIDPSSGKNNSISIAGFGADDKASAFQIYNDKLYLLLADKNQIFRLTKSGNGFSNKASWLKAEVSLGDAVDMAVTSEIMILRSNGQLNKFKLGQVQADFHLVDIDPALNSASLVKVADNRIFILDSKSKRLLIFDKQGVLSRQYLFSSLNNLKDFSVSADNKTAYLLNDEAVYKINLD